MPTNRHQRPARPRLRGDEAELFTMYSEKLKRVVGASVYTSDANVQDACAFAWGQLLTRDPRRETVFPWLARVATREAWRLHRLERRDDRTEDTDRLDGLESPLGDAVLTDLLALQETIEAVQTLHPRRRAMLLLHAAGFSYKEIAAAHGITTGRAYALVAKARRQLVERTARDQPPD